MEGIRYEPIPPTIVFQRATREGRFILYFVPADAVPAANHVEAQLFALVPDGSLPYSRAAAQAK